MITNRPPSPRIIARTRPGAAPRLIRIPISPVRTLTENASTAPMPIAAITSARRLNEPSNSAFNRRGPTLSSRISSTVITFSTGCVGSMLRMIARAAVAMPAGSTPARTTSPPNGKSLCANGKNTAGIGAASSPPSFVLPTTPTTVRQSPDTPMNRSTSPVHAMRRPTGSTSGKMRSASV